MLCAFWSPKGGVGTSVLAASAAALLARADGVRLVDLAGDQPAILGLAADPGTGIAQWAAAGPDTPPDALVRLSVEVAPGLHLLPAGPPRALAPQAAAEAGGRLATLLAADATPVVVDAGRADTVLARALVAGADVSVVVLRGCYLALRRAVHSPLTRTATGVAFVDEPGRALGVAEITDVLGRPVLARVPVRGPIARAVDAGVVAVRTPEPLARAVGRILERLSPGPSTVAVPPVVGPAAPAA